MSSKPEESSWRIAAVTSALHRDVLESGRGNIRSVSIRFEWQDSHSIHDKKEIADAAYRGVKDAPDTVSPNQSSAGKCALLPTEAISACARCFAPVFKDCTGREIVP